MATSVRVTALWTVSVPSLASSVTTSVAYVHDIRIVTRAASQRVVAGAPSRTLLPALPVSVLASVLPVALTLPLPVSVRFSTLAAKRQRD